MSTAVTFRMGSLNLAQLTNWTKVLLYRNGKPITRRMLAGELLKNRFQCSVYTLQETTHEMAAYLAGFLRWGTEKQPSWRTDENRNTILWDPRKWRDLNTMHFSLTERPGDLGDEHHRSVAWVLLEHRETGVQVWFGSSHLSNGETAGAERAAQARIIAATRPLGPCVLGVDRNSLYDSEPAAILNRAGLVDMTVGASRQRTFPAGNTQLDGVQIDAVHADGVVVALPPVLLDPDKATDHRGWKVTFTVPAL